MVAPADMMSTVGEVTDRSEWQGRVGSSWAEEWQRTDRSFASLTSVLLDRISSSLPASRIVDIGCGAGELSLELARLAPDAELLGLDVSPDLVAAASHRAGGTSNLRYAVADAANWRDAEFQPDLLVSRHGVMFFDDPVAAFANLADCAVAGASLIFSCFRSPAENGWARNIAALLPAQPAGDPYAPGPFAFADSERIASILSHAGWADIGFEAVDFDYVAGAGSDPVADAVDFFHAIGPAARAIRLLDGDARTGFVDRLTALAADHLKDGAVRFEAAAWIVTAKKPNKGPAI